MSSPPEGKLETKAGHPPAVKVAGIRIVQKHPHTGDGKEKKDKDDQEWESTSPPKPTVYISGSCYCLLPGLVACRALLATGVVHGSKANSSLTPAGNGWTWV
uniref:Death-associated protein n=1 Tax=Rattus norvegicus TaxID=10116 RepID=A0A8L2Q727_RAT